MIKKDDRLCADLRFIHDYEVEHGNTVSHVCAPAGTECPFAIVFANPLTIIGSEAATSIPAFIEFWESRDPHYAIEAGYVCTSTNTPSPVRFGAR